MTEVSIKNSRDSWKNKAKLRNARIKELNKELKALQLSRDTWKSKYKSSNINRASVISVKDYDLVKHHSFDSGVIWLCIWLQSVGKCSFRSCRQVFIGIGMYVGVSSSRVPSFSSVRLWVCKYGYHVYHQHKEGERWAIIADESVVIGQERLLLLLGVNLDNWAYEQALGSADVEVLGVEIATSWTSASISEQVAKLQKRYQIAYSISDAGNNLQGAWKLRNLPNISDCTHHWAKSLEKIYQRDDNFLAFMDSVAAIRRKWILSKHSFLLPPPSRTKSRFHQVFAFVDWAESIKSVWYKLNEEQKQELTFVENHQGLLNSLKQMQIVVGQLNQILKIKGLSQQTITNASQILEDNLKEGVEILKFKSLVQSYLLKYQDLTQNQQTYLCCSDIIESTFGRYKQTIAKNNKNITELVLALATLGKKITPQQVKNAMEQVKVKDVHQWKTENTTPSLAKIKHDFFNKNGEKN